MLTDRQNLVIARSVCDILAKAISDIQEVLSDELEVNDGRWFPIPDCHQSTFDSYVPEIDPQRSPRTENVGMPPDEVMFPVPLDVYHPAHNDTPDRYLTDGR